MALRVHVNVPHDYIPEPQSAYIASTLWPKYFLFRDMDTEGYISFGSPGVPFTLFLVQGSL